MVYPQAATFTIDSGESELSSYWCASRDRPHRFCRLCGSSMFIDSRQSKQESFQNRVALNFRMVPGFEDILPQLKLKGFDGKNVRESVYRVPDQ